MVKSHVDVGQNDVSQNIQIFIEKIFLQTILKEIFNRKDSNGKHRNF